MGKKKQDPLGGTYVSPVTWAKKQDPLGGTYVSPRDVGKKKTRPTRGDVCLTQRRGQKKRLTRGDVCLTQRRGHTKKKQDPLGGTYVSPRDVGKKTRPMWGRRDSTLSPPTGLGRRGLLMPLLPIRGDMGAHPCPPR